jgi:hypothetical protein
MLPGKAITEPWKMSAEAGDMSLSALGSAIKFDLDFMRFRVAGWLLFQQRAVHAHESLDVLRVCQVFLFCLCDVWVLPDHPPGSN